MAKVVLDLASDEFYYHFPADLYEWLVQRFTDHFFVYVGSNEQLLEEIEDADVFWGWKISGDALKRAKQLKWIMFADDAVSGRIVPELIGMDTIITNSGGVRAQGVAEHAFAMMLTHARRLVERQRQQDARVYDPDHFVRVDPLPFELAGRTITILGYGSIGSQIGLLAKSGFGMTVVAVRRNPELPCEGADHIYDAQLLNQALAHADFVVLALPGTNKTFQMFGNAQLAAMRSTAFLINIGHPSVLNTDALVPALRHRRIAGAALDALDPVPGEDSPLWTFDNLVISPNYAGVTPNLWSHMAQLFSENLELFLSKRPLLNQVDIKLGY